MDSSGSNQSQLSRLSRSSPAYDMVAVQEQAKTIWLKKIHLISLKGLFLAVAMRPAMELTKANRENGMQVGLTFSQGARNIRPTVMESSPHPCS